MKMRLLWIRPSPLGLLLSALTLSLTAPAVSVGAAAPADSDAADGARASPTPPLAIRVDPAQCPEGNGNPSHNAARTIGNVPVKLKPEFAYQFMLNADGFDSFRSAEVVPLEPVAVKFTTGK